jgi:hypothetical protein
MRDRFEKQCEYANRSTGSGAPGTAADISVLEIINR